MAVDEPRPGSRVRDVRQIDLSECVRRSLPPMLGQRDGGFQVVMNQSVLNRIHAHGHGHLEEEVCGVLVGMPCRDESGPYLHVEAALVAEGASSQAASVTFTAAAWATIQDEMDRRYPDSRIVGWYHTHPGFGIFLSGMDLFIHESFFDLPWQIALVYDPIGGDEGTFVWHDNHPIRQPFLVLDDAVRQRFVVDPAVAARVPEPTEFPADEPPPVTAPSPSGRRLLYVALAVCTLLLVITALSMLASIHP